MELLKRRSTDLLNSTRAKVKRSPRSRKLSKCFVCIDEIVGENDAYDVELPLFGNNDHSFVKHISPREYYGKYK